MKRKYVIAVLAAAGVTALGGATAFASSSDAGSHPASNTTHVTAVPGAKPSGKIIPATPVKVGGKGIIVGTTGVTTVPGSGTDTTVTPVTGAPSGKIVMATPSNPTSTFTIVGQTGTTK